jgi:hypothetical protein
LFRFDDLIKPHGSIYLVRGCFDNPEGLNNGHFLSGRGPQVLELANSLRLCTTVPSQDLSVAWVTVRW